MGKARNDTKTSMSLSVPTVPQLLADCTEGCVDWKLTKALIPHNPADPLPYQPSTEATVERFKNILESKGIHTYVRRPRGRDIFAACGQLAARQSTLTNLSEITSVGANN